MVLDTLERNADSLLDATLLPEIVRVYEGPDEGTLQVLVGYVGHAIVVGSSRSAPDRQVVRSGQGRRCGWLGLDVDVGRALLCNAAAAEAASNLGRLPLIPLEGLLFLSRRKRTVELAIDEEVVHDATGAPVDTVGPSLDARRVLLVDKHIATLDELGPLLVVGTARDVCEHAVEATLEDDEGIPGVLDVAYIGRRQRTALRG